MEDNRFPFDSGFDDGVYGTGCTEPPKSHRAIVALLLVAVIFLGGISTALSVLNIKMFQKLNEQEATAIAYASAAGPSRHRSPRHPCGRSRPQWPSMRLRKSRRARRRA